MYLYRFYYIILIFFIISIFFPFSVYSQNKNNYVIIIDNIFPKLKPAITSKNAKLMLHFGQNIRGNAVLEQGSGNLRFIEIYSTKDKCKVYVPMPYVLFIPDDYNKSFDRLLIEINEDNPVPLAYTPPDLMELKTNFILSYNHKEIHVSKSIGKGLAKLFTMSKKTKYVLKVVRGHEDLNTQINKYKQSVEQSNNLKQIDEYKPGLSPFSLGTTIEITNNKIGLDYEKVSQDDDFYVWLRKAAIKSGFKPLDKHYRFRFYGKSIEKYLSKEELKIYKEKIDEIPEPEITISSKDYPFRKLFSITVERTQNEDFVTYLWIHNNEKTAGKTMSYALNKYGGRAVTINNKDKRSIKLSHLAKDFEIDPNRLFTERGIRRYIKKYYKKIKSKSIINNITNYTLDIKDFLLSNLKRNKGTYLIAIHSNRSDTNFSINTFTKDTISKYYDVYLNKKHNPKNFFYVTNNSDYIYFKKKNYNVVYQKKIDDDGSLSIYSAMKGYPYINIEVEEGDDEFQIRMMDEVIKLIKLRKKK